MAAPVKVMCKLSKAGTGIVLAPWCQPQCLTYIQGWKRMCWMNVCRFLGSTVRDFECVGWGVFLTVWSLSHVNENHLQSLLKIGCLGPTFHFLHGMREKPYFPHLWNSWVGTAATNAVLSGGVVLVLWCDSHPLHSPQRRQSIQGRLWASTLIWGLWQGQLSSYGIVASHLTSLSFLASISSSLYFEDLPPGQPDLN